MPRLIVWQITPTIAQAAAKRFAEHMGIASLRLKYMPTSATLTPASSA